MTVPEMQDLIKLVEFPDYTFTIEVDGRGATYLQASYLDRDVDTPWKEELQKTRRWFLSPFMTKSEIVQTCLKCVLTSMEHKVREWFTYKGERVFGPHFDVEALVEIARAKKTDERKDF